jgi:hypothetical protein
MENNYLYYDFLYPKRFGPFLEEWKEVIGFEGKYAISNYGRGKSLARYVKYKNSNEPRFYQEKILSNFIASNGYNRFTFCVNNKLHERLIIPTTKPKLTIKTV